MKKLVLIMVILIVYMNVASCSKEDIITSNNLGNQETITTTSKPIDNSQEYNRSGSFVAAVPTEVLPSSTSPMKEQEIQLTKEESEKLGILIKWIYQANWTYIGDDRETPQIPEELKLLPTDLEKISFVLNMAVFERMVGSTTADGMYYKFTAKEADALVSAAVGDSFDEHKASAYISDYKDGIYSYMLAGGDGATWWPEIELKRIALITKDEIRIEGILKCLHDVYEEEYSYEFEATAFKNLKSPFGGFTLQELEIP